MSLALIQVIASAADTPGTRAAVCGVATMIGIILIAVGRYNIKTQQASESGSRRMLSKLMGGTGEYEGNAAVRMGVIRIVIGVGAIIFGIVFLFVGPFLAK